MKVHLTSTYVAASRSKTREVKIGRQPEPVNHVRSSQRPSDRYLYLRTLHALGIIDLAVIYSLGYQADVAIEAKIRFSVRFLAFRTDFHKQLTFHLYPMNPSSTTKSSDLVAEDESKHSRRSFL